ncbi:MAG TPA: hypothetical protein VN739_01645 [Nitrososphaerales archaeon]|nr:hypothetical protein [Nitrososphaerales archaeon]
MEDPRRRQEIQSNLKSIVESSDRWLGRLKRRELRVRFATAFLTTILVFAGVGIAVLVFLFSQGQLSAFLQHPNQSYSLITASGLSGLISGFATYFLLRRKHNAELKDLSSLITEMQKTNGKDGRGITEDALSLADKILTLLPQLVRKRNQDSLLFGVVAFILAAIFGNNLAVGILVGVIVWLYFRYEAKKTYEQEISKFEEQRRVFEQRKKDFIETL